MIPAGLKASSEWFPAKERSIAVGYFNVGSSIGAMIAAAAGGMGNRNAQLAEWHFHLRCIELYLGDGMADFL
ncbi:hexuronate transporter [Escherichia coli]|nr:hexuronate transporter [Escherichia coli]